MSAVRICQPYRKDDKKKETGNCTFKNSLFYKSNLKGRSKLLGQFMTRFYINLPKPKQQCDQIWRNFATLAKLYMSLPKFWQFISYLAKCWAYFCKIWYIIGLIFIVANGQILQNNLTIWSHWTLLTFGPVCSLLLLNLMPTNFSLKRWIGIDFELLRKWENLKVVQLDGEQRNQCD